MDIKVEDHIALVYSVAKKYKNNPHFEYDDLVSYGCIGLIKAANNFDESRGFAFSTYAIPMIKGSILAALRDLSGRLGNRNMKSAGTAYKPIPISCFVSVDKEGRDQEVDLGIEEDFAEGTVDKIDIANYLDKLNIKEREVVECYYFSDMRQTEIAKKLNISQVQVSRLMNKAIEKIKNIYQEDLDMSEYSKIDRINKWLDENFDKYEKQQDIVKQLCISFTIKKATAGSYISNWKNRKTSNEELPVKNIETTANNTTNILKAPVKIDVKEIKAEGENGEYSITKNSISLSENEKVIVVFRNVKELDTWYGEFRSLFKLQQATIAN